MLGPYSKRGPVRELDSKIIRCMQGRLRKHISLWAVDWRLLTGEANKKTIQHLSVLSPQRGATYRLAAPQSHPSPIGQECEDIGPIYHVSYLTISGF